MVPLYKIITPTQTFIGYYYRYCTRVRKSSRYANPRIDLSKPKVNKVDFTWSTHTSKIDPKYYFQFYHQVAVTSDTQQQIPLRNQVTLCNCIFRYDINHRLIFEHDIVSIALDSHLQETVGIVYLDKILMSYCVYIIKSPKVEQLWHRVSFAEYSFEVLGNIDELVPLYPDMFKKLESLVDNKLLALAKLKIAYLEYIPHPFETNTEPDFLRYNKTTCKIDYLLEGSSESTFRGYPVARANNSIEIVVPQTIEEAETDLDLYSATHAFERGIRPTTIFVTEDKVHSHIYLNRFRTLQDWPVRGSNGELLDIIFEEDKVISIDTPDRYGFAHYDPYLLNFGVKVPEDSPKQISFFSEVNMPLVKKQFILKYNKVGYLSQWCLPGTRSPKKFRFVCRAK